MLTTVPQNDQVTGEFVRNHIQGKPWDEARHLLQEHFDSTEVIRRFNDEFMALKIAPNETMNYFCDRVRMVVKRAHLDKNSVMVRDAFLKAIPYDIAKHLIRDALHMHNLDELLNLACSWTALDNSIKKGISTLNSFSTTEAEKCSYCKYKGHNVNECRRKKRDESQIPAKPAQTSNVPVNNQNNHKTSNPVYSTAQESKLSAQAKPFGPKLSVNQMCVINKNFQTTENCATTMNKTHLTDTLNHSNATNKSIEFTLTIDSVETTGMLDTGAEASIMSRDFANQLNLPCESTSIQLQSFSKNSIVVPCGIARNVKVRFGSQFESIDFIIINEMTSNNILLGMDFFQKFSLYIGGIKLNFAKENELSSQHAPKNEYSFSVHQNTDQREHILETIAPLIQENQKTLKKFCKHPEATVSLDTGTNPPSWVSQYHIAKHLHDKVDVQIQEWLANGIITNTPQGCEWNSPLLVVGKTSYDNNQDKYRVCLDPRHINTKLKNDKFPIPTLRSLLDRTSPASVYSCIDLKHSFHQLKIRDEDQCKTSFTWKGSQYMFIGAPFGLKILTSIFQRMITQLFQKFDFVACFVDDILIFSDSLEEHKIHLQLVLQTLTDFNLTVNESKCKFIYEQMNVLGYNLSKTGIKIDSRKTSELWNIPQPVSSKDIQSFLGFTNYLRDFIPNYAKITKVLDELRNETDVKGKWTSAHQQAFDAIRIAISNADGLSFPDSSRPFILATDASSYALGSVLFQIPNGESINWMNTSNMNFIKFISRSLTSAEQNYGASKRELLAIVFSLQKLEEYLIGQHVIILTDHKPLSYLMSQVRLSQLQQTWFDTFLKFDLEIFYFPGHQNILPDQLSRLLPDAHQKLRETIVSIRSENVIHPTQIDSTTINSQQNVSIASEEQMQIVLEEHLISHLATNSLFDALTVKGHSWDGLKEDCEKVYKSCVACQKNTIVKKGYNPQQSITANYPMEAVAIDTMGPYPASDDTYHFILIVVDVFSRFVWLMPLKSKCAPVIAKKLFKLFVNFGHPKIIQSDNGTEFINDIIDHLRLLFSWEHRRSTPYYPQSNGIAERSVGETKDLLRKRMELNPINWHLLIPSVQFGLNAKIHSLHHSSPFAVMFTRPINEFKQFNSSATIEPTQAEIEKRYQLANNIIFPALSERAAATIEKRNQRWNKRHNLTIDLKIDAIVMVKVITPTSLQSPYVGPFKIVRQNRAGNFILRDGNNNILPRPFTPSRLKVVISDTLSNRFFVEQIVDHRRNEDGTIHFKTRWLGYPESSDTWEPSEHFDDASIIKNYINLQSSNNNWEGSDVNNI